MQMPFNCGLIGYPKETRGMLQTHPGVGTCEVARLWQIMPAEKGGGLVGGGAGQR